MSDWITVHEKERSQALVEDQEQADTEETRVFTQRTAYHKALNALHASSGVGDEDWITAKTMLMEITDNLQSLINKAENSGQPSSRDSSVQEYTQISFLVSKNLSRIIAKEGLYQQALAIGIDACERMFELEQFDAGLIFRVASMALQNDCSWSSRQLLHFNKKRISDLYGHAIKNLENAIERRESVVKEIVALKEISESSVISSQSVRRIAEESVNAEDAVKLLNDFMGTVVTADVEQIGSLCLDQVIAFLDTPLGTRATMAEEKSQGGQIEVNANEKLDDSSKGENVEELVVTESAADSLTPNDTSTSAVAKDIENEQQEPDSATSLDPLKQSEGSSNSRRSSRKRRVSTMLDPGNDRFPQTLARKAVPSSKSEPAREGESKEFFESAQSILDALLSAELPLKIMPSAEQLFDEFQNMEVSCSRDEATLPVEGLALHDRAVEASLMKTTNSMIEAIVSSSQANNTHNLMTGFIRSLSQTIEDTLHRGISPAVETGIDYDKLSSSVVKCWSYIVIKHNFSAEDSLMLFSVSEALFIVECCSDFVRYADRLESKIQDKLLDCYEVARSTLDISLLHWSTQASLAPDVPEMQTLRRSWVFLTYWLTGRKGEQCAHIAEMDTKNLLNIIRDIINRVPHVQLPHLRGWSVVNEDKISLLEAILQDNVKLRSLVESHTDTSTWLESALAVLRKDGDVASAFRMGAKRKVGQVSCLPLLALRTCRSLGDRVGHDIWWNHFCRIIAEGLGSILKLVKEGAEDVTEIEEWFNSSLEFIGELVPPIQEGSIETIALKTSYSLSLLMLIAHEMGNHNIFSSLCEFAVTYLRKTKCDRVVGVFAKMTIALIAVSKPTSVATSGAKLQKNCESLILNFALQLVALGAFTLLRPNEEETLGFVSFILNHRGGENKTFSTLRNFTDASILTAIFLGWRGQDVTIDQKVDLLCDYHSLSCDFDLYALDKGRSLFHFASLLQTSVEANYFIAKNAAIGKEDRELCFNFQNNGTARQRDVSTCLGEMYWLLFGFPLVTFSYTDDSSKQCTHFRLPADDPETIEKLFIFYLDGVSLGLGNRGERRSSLNFLTQTRILVELPHKLSSHAEIFRGVFLESLPISVETLRKTVMGQPEIDEESQRIVTLMPETLGSIFYERLVYAGDMGTGYEVLDINYICKEFPVPEQRVLFAVDLCLRDLAFNPRRYSTWLLLHVKLAEYIEIICDELGELCIPELLAPQMHMLMRPSVHTSMKNILDGDLRFAAEAIEAMEKVFYKRTGLDAKAIVRKAWTSKQVAAEQVYPLVATKNMLREGMLSVYAIINADNKSLTTIMPRGHETTAEYKSNSRFQPHVTHGRTMQLLSMDFDESHPSWRDFISMALKSYQVAIHESSLEANKSHINPRTALFSLCQAVKTEWSLYRKPGRTIEVLIEAVHKVPTYISKDPARINSLNDLIPVVVDIALQLLVDCDDEETNKVWAVILRMSEAKMEQVSGSSEKTIDVVGKFKIAEPSSIAGKLWTTIAISLFMLRDIRSFSKHDAHSIFTIATTLKRLSETLCLDWFKCVLQDCGVLISYDAALHEIRKLFSKRVPQIIALWSVERAENEWDSQLQRIYVYEYLRRKYARLLSELCVHCGGGGSSISFTFELAKDASNRLKETSKTRKAATVRWLLDLAVRTASKIVCSEPVANRVHLSGMFELIQYLEAKQGQISENGYRRLRNSIIVLYSLEVPASQSTSVTLTEALRYCFQKYGKAGGHSLFSEVGKRGAPQTTSAANKAAKTTESKKVSSNPIDENTEVELNVA